jgi:hypothetical protein
MRPLVAVSLLCLVVLAGCVGSVGGGETPTATAQQETATRTPTKTTVTTTTPAVPPRATAVNTVDFGNLSEGQQEAFLDALDYEVSFGPESRAVVAYDVDLFRDGFSNPVDYVRYEGAFYRIEVQRISYAYTSQAYSMVPATPGPNESVTDFEDLRESDQEKVRAAITGQYRSPFSRGAGGPVVFQKSYIRYEGDVYSPKRTMIADAPKIEMEVIEYEGNGTTDTG